MNDDNEDDEYDDYDHNDGDDDDNWDGDDDNGWNNYDDNNWDDDDDRDDGNDDNNNDGNDDNDRTCEDDDGDDTPEWFWLHISSIHFYDLDVSNTNTKEDHDTIATNDFFVVNSSWGVRLMRNDMITSWKLLRYFVQDTLASFISNN